MIEPETQEAGDTRDSCLMEEVATIVVECKADRTRAMSLADAYVKGLKGGINWTDSYAATKANAEAVPYNNFDPQDLTESTKEGRSALPDWLKYGFVTPNFGRSVSKTVEYSLNDFALCQVAKDMMPSDAARYLNRSAWQRIWSHNLTSFHFTGFLAPKFANGTILPSYSPLSCGECEWTAIAYEALPWEYSWTIPFDMATLISFMGGPEARLDAMFIAGLKTTAVGSGGTNPAPRSSTTATSPASSLHSSITTCEAGSTSPSCAAAKSATSTTSPYPAAGLAILTPAPSMAD